MLYLRMIVQTLGMILVLGLTLFLPARTLDWPGAWVFLGLLTGLSLAVGVWLARVDPGLLEERMKPLVQADQRPWDKVLTSAFGLTFLAWHVGMGLEVGAFGMRTPPWAQGLGGVLILVTYWAVARVFRENRFAAPVVKAQAGQTVISTGPYAIVRHPMYAAAILLFIGEPLLLGAPWGLVYLVMILPLLAIRTRGEEAMLRAELTGYDAYAAKVRFRMLPGVW